MKLVLPPDRSIGAGRCVFLAGPIQDAPDWQQQAACRIHARRPDVWIGNPRRVYLDGEFVYEDQVDWETYALARAGRDGVVLFWLTPPVALPFRERLRRAWRILRGRQLRPYAQTSRFELGEWAVRHQRDGVQLVVGVDAGFSNGRYIRRRLGQDCPDVPVCSTLEETVDAALRLVDQAK